MLSDVRSAREIRGAILSVIAREAPVGQGAICLDLRKHGITLSIPTIGRRLQELEFEGLVEKVGVQGRILTDRGHETLNQLHAEAMLKGHGTALLKTLTRGDKKHLLDLLFVRGILEGTTAALAAEHASQQTVERLEELLEQQQASIARGELGVQEDVTYHNEIARASGNTVLASLVALLRQHHRYNLAMTSIRAEVGSRLVVDHGAILDAIKEKDPVAARKAMELHLRTLAEDLNRFWKESSSAARHRSDTSASKGSAAAG
ncbi:MAG TPA: FCD domain-containing protein [Gemmatimonadales bacterium]